MENVTNAEFVPSVRLPDIPLPETLHWSEGMLLSPQHLQQNDLYWHAQLRHRMACLSPYFWGVLHLEIDTPALSTGLVSIMDLRCVLPDGLALEFSRHDGEFARHYAGQSLSINVDKLCNIDGKPIKVWVVVPTRTKVAANASSSMRRYDPGNSEEEIDEGLGDNPVTVERLKPRLALYAGPKPPAQYAGCPILEVARDAEGHVHLTAFHPPMLRVAAAHFQSPEYDLHARLGRLTRELWRKIKSLAGERTDDQKEEEVGLSNEARRNLSLARHLATALPQLDILVQSGETAPADLYQALALLVGQTSILGANPVPLMMDAYRHEDCNQQFSQAIAYIESKLSLINTAYEVLMFTAVGDSAFSLRLPKGLSTDAVYVEIKLRAGQSVKAAENWLRAAWIANDALMPVLKQRRLPGAAVRLLAPQEISRLNLRPSLAMFLIENRQIELPNQGVVNMLDLVHPMQIQGPEDANVPTAVVLYHFSQATLSAVSSSAKQTQGADDD